MKIWSTYCQASRRQGCLKTPSTSRRRGQNAKKKKKKKVSGARWQTTQKGERKRAISLLCSYDKTIPLHVLFSPSAIGGMSRSIRKTTVGFWMAGGGGGRVEQLEKERKGKEKRGKRKRWARKAGKKYGVIRRKDRQKTKAQKSGCGNHRARTRERKLGPTGSSC